MDDAKYTLTPGKVSEAKMGQLMVAKNSKLDSVTREFPYDYIYYNFYKTDNGFIVYQEMYTATKEKQLNKMFIPKEMIDYFISNLASEELLKD
jgi:hypothetical protein